MPARRIRPIKILCIDLAHATRKWSGGGVGFNPPTQRGISSEAERLRIECEDLADHGTFLRRLPEILRSGTVDGILGRANLSLPGLARPWSALGKKIPLVNLLMDPKTPGSNFVGSDEEAGMGLLVSHLVQEGHESFGFAAQDHLPYTLARFKNLRRELAQRGKNILWEWAPSFDPKSGNFRSGREKSGRSPQREKFLIGLFTRFEREGKFPDALLFETDRFAGSFYLEANRRGLRIPGHVSITGFDDSQLRLPPYGANNLTTIRQDFEGIGRMAVRMLHEIIRGKRPRENQRLLLPISLIVRRTSLRKSPNLSQKKITPDDFRSRVQGLLFQHYSEARPSAFIAKALDLSPEFFLVKYKQTFGQKFTRALHELRIERAVFDLMNTQKTITEIHHEHGFETHQSFNRAFFRKHHTTPTLFRKRGLKTANKTS